MTKYEFRKLAFATLIVVFAGIAIYTVASGMYCSPPTFTPEPGEFTVCLAEFHPYILLVVGSLAGLVLTIVGSWILNVWG